MPGTPHRSLFLGSYTESMQGRGTGIAVYELDEDGLLSGAPVVTPVSSPSFLVLSPDRLFAVTEEASGAVSSFERTGARLEPLGTVPTGGADPCHLVHDAAGARLLVTNYSSGSVTTAPLDPTGAPVTPTVTPCPPGHGPVADRQAEPHAHQVIAAESGRDTWLVADLGGDRLLEYGGTPLELLREHPLPPGSGPRHQAWAEGALLVSGELDSRLHVLRRTGDELVHATAVPTYFGAPGIESYPSHLVVVDRVAYLANRVRDTIAVFDLAPLAAGGSPTLVQEVPCGGAWPRHFAVEGDLLYVANQHSDEVTVFAIEDPTTGRLRADPVQRVSAGSPACVVLA